MCGSRPFLVPLIVVSLGAGPGVPSSRAQGAPEGEPAVGSPRLDPHSPLDAGERTTLLRLAWQTLEGHLRGLPIRNEDLQSFDFSPRHMAKRGCFVTLEIDGEIHGLQGEFEPTRPLYQQVIVFVRRAATRDPRYSPLTEHDMERIRLRIDLIGDHSVVENPHEVVTEGRGVFLQKWGRSAVFLPALLAGRRWDAERTLAELTRQAALPEGSWKRGARIEVFSTDVIEGMRPTPWGPDVWGEPGPQKG